MKHGHGTRDMTNNTTRKAAGLLEGGINRRIHPDLWFVHGVYYDLTDFIDRHPGGRENMHLGRGRDCTELFESVHSLSQLDMPSILAKYRVPTPAGYQDGAKDADLFRWEKGGFYDVLKHRVRNYFDKQGGNHKAPWSYWPKIALLFAVWFSLVRYALQTGSIVPAFVAGSVMMMLGFCIFHDGSHYGISKRVWINQTLHTIWGNWNLWFHALWLRHHVYGHHSYTGIFQQDPDLHNSEPFIRKHPNTEYNKAHAFQHIYGVFLYMFNFHIGQSILYVRALFLGKICYVPLEQLPRIDIILWALVFIPSVFCHFILPFFLVTPEVSKAWTLFMIICYFSAIGFWYFLCVIPNHDTIDHHEQLLLEGEEKRDWGLHQVLSSGNHTTNPDSWWSWILTEAFGGINYQIEHHLFPAVSHEHLPEIGKIVRQTCQEFGVHYTTHSWPEALWKFLVLLWVLRNPKEEEVKPGVGSSSKKKIQ